MRLHSKVERLEQHVTLAGEPRRLAQESAAALASARSKLAAFIAENPFSEDDATAERGPAEKAADLWDFKEALWAKAFGRKE